MAVSNELIMDRMIAEIQKAKTAMHEKKDWKLHIAHTQLLSDLLLDGRKETTDKKLTPLESKPVQIVSEEMMEETDTSIFDF